MLGVLLSHDANYSIICTMSTAIQKGQAGHPMGPVLPTFLSHQPQHFTSRIGKCWASCRHMSSFS